MAGLLGTEGSISRIHPSIHEFTSPGLVSFPLKVARSVSSAEKFLEVANPEAGQSGAADDRPNPEGKASMDDSSGDLAIPAATQPLTNLVVDYCPNHVTISGSTATIRLDKACG